jgi:thiosulfate/3-mercaptopyruvate sulfurtransferase
MAVLAAEAVRALGPVRLLDARSGPDAKQRFGKKRLEGSRWLSLEDDLSERGDPKLGGRHPFAPPEKLCAALGREGVRPEDTIVVLDDKDGANAAARLYVMLRALGHEAVHFLDGGLTGAEGVLPIAAGAPLDVPMASYPPRPYALPRVTMAEVEAKLGSPGVVLLDARAGARFRGETEPFDPPAGHVPGATSMPYAELCGPDGKLLGRDPLKERLGRATKGASEVLLQCGSGVTACLLAIGLEEAGLMRIGDPRMSLWVGSYSEWSRNAKPIATGP